MTPNQTPRQMARYDWVVFYAHRCPAAAELVCSAAEGFRIMEVIRLLHHRWELRGTLYFEFQPGLHAGLHWQPGSVFVREEFWADLGAVVGRHAPGYSHYSFTPIAAPSWDGVLS